ncbi:MerR family transcriptional regulator [Enterococcus hirae]|nr:MerR family transcriptional regulator [Enterococcus hirae]MBO1091801.1 MerR family DNA-binding transcriptional regulator [Enterococcus hirae]QKX73174.1 MerR family transcriptional regulator [Enterococcus hirae]QQU13688.1 MerR family transcriptional regulator [Enterococcus hirae]TGY26336.1 MerR family DNA-binding transcriptional regulator [Enterococcus hirae]
MISITDLSKLFNVSVRTIRYYEQIGLIENSKRIRGKRYFDKKKQ